MIKKRTGLPIILPAYQVFLWKSCKMVLLALLMYFTLCSPGTGQETDQSCFDNCECCRDRECKTAFGWTNVCTKGCIDGHRAARCYELCMDDNCKSCNENYAECKACYDGLYVGQDKRCYICPSNCKTCSSNTACTSCNEGFYDKDGSTNCKYSYCPGNCECTTDQRDCISCQTGFYGTNAMCSHVCPTNCISCVSRESCGACKYGFYNGFRNGVPETGLPLNNCTFGCRETCKMCQSYNNCTQCVNGKFGFICQEDCSVGCANRKCLIESGNCKCSMNFTGNKCTQCVDGRYGKFCNETCSKYCKVNRCEKTSGSCTNGCITEALIGNTCSRCKLGLYGELCNQTCPLNCNNNICERYSGKCSDGCKANFNGAYCDACVNGKHGLNCEQSCPTKCSAGICDKNTGGCINCVENYNGPKCETCRPGLFGQNCNDKCSLYCSEGTCDRDTGVCINGCVVGYSGDMCCVKNENCMNCSTTTDCKKCVTGFYQQNCTEKCPGTCFDSCELYTGTCYGCKADYFGRFCKLTCSRNCSRSHKSNKSQCKQSDGTCLNGCVKGQYGILCHETCSRSCIDSSCWQDSGKCIYGCVSEQDGPLCLQSSDTQQQQEETNTKPVATAAALGSVLSVSLLVNIGLLVYIVVKRIKKSRRAQTEQIYENQLATSETQFTQGIPESDVPQTEAAKRCIYEEIHRENETEHEYNI